jgi:NAD(P)H-hydrate epimerase
MIIATCSVTPLFQSFGLSERRRGASTVRHFHIELLQMMENAGRNLAHLARTRFLDGEPRGKRVIVLAGTDGNGGGALVCARRLHSWGAQVQVFVTKDDNAFTPVPGHQLDILRRMQVPIALAAAVTQVGRPT